MRPPPQSRPAADHLPTAEAPPPSDGASADDIQGWVVPHSLSCSSRPTHQPDAAIVVRCTTNMRARILLLLLAVIVRLGTALRVTVVGGTGFVGSRVCKALVARAVTVTSVSRSGRIPQWAAGESWTRDVEWVSVDLLGDDDAAVDAAMGSPDSVISCVGVVDPDPEVLRRGNGVANVKAFSSAKRAGVKRAVYISVASEVASWGPNPRRSPLVVSRL